MSSRFDMQIEKLAKAKRARSMLNRSIVAVLALAIALLLLALKFDTPQGGPEYMDAVVLGCWKPWRSTSGTAMKCRVRIGAKEELDLWSSVTRPTSSRVSVLQFRRRYSGGPVYVLADPAP